MKKLLFLALAISVIGCQSPSPAKKAETKKVIANYAINFIKDQYNQENGKIELLTITDSIAAANDTTAYLAAFKKFYANKIKERENFSLAQWKSFTITDKNGIDLKSTLPGNIVDGIENQVKNSPEVRKYIDDVNRDSLPY